MKELIEKIELAAANGMPALEKALKESGTPPDLFWRTCLLISDFYMWQTGVALLQVSKLEQNEAREDTIKMLKYLLEKFISLGDSSKRQMSILKLVN